MKVMLANLRGFCAGVERAIDSVVGALDLFGPPVYVRHEIVHNRHVVEGLRARGAEFVEDLAEVPDGAVLVFSAHGVSRNVEAQARARGLTVIDATCPLVTKVHLEVAQHARAGRTVFLIGHHDHPEVQGTLGHYSGSGQISVIESEEDVMHATAVPGAPVAYVTQTTLSLDDTARIVDAIRARFPQLQGPHKDDICYATQNRQRAVRELAQHCDVIIVVGAAHSSNSTRLREIAQACGTPAYLVDSAEWVERRWFDRCAVIGVSSGASVPEVLVAELLATFRRWWPGLTEESLGQPEQVHFRLPNALQNARRRDASTTRSVRSGADDARP